MAPNRDDWGGLLYHSKVIDNLNSGFVLADALEEKGFTKISKILNSKTKLLIKILKNGGQFTDRKFVILKNIEKRIYYILPN